jgi:hypothetical protein
MPSKQANVFHAGPLKPHNEEKTDELEVKIAIGFQQTAVFVRMLVGCMT